MGFIYKITTPTGRLYVGKTYHIGKRMASHRCSAKKNARGIILLNSIKKYGWDAHKVEIIEEVDDNIMDEREIFWIKELKTYCYDNPEGCNMTKGGEGQRTTWMHKIEQRENQSKRYSGSGNPFYGKKHSKTLLERRSKEVSEYNRKNGIKVPKWGAEKGWAAVRREVIAYGKNGKFIGEYNSLTQCAQQLGIKIQGVKDSLKYDQWHIGEYKFKYKTENYPPVIEVGEIKKKWEKRPVFWMSDEFEPITEFNGLEEAAKFFGIPAANISRSALQMMPLRSGHFFVYKDEYEKYKQSFLN